MIMHKITSIAAGAGTAPFATLTLPFEKRQICRQRVVLDNGDEASLIIDRGTVLRDGDLLTTEDGKFIQVRAADETVSTVYTEDCQQLARAAYHLGNRHVSLEVQPGRLRYLHDHVLDHMVHELGLSVVVENAPFEPESGAYSHGSHDHAHSHAEGHGHGHGHSH
jgi:urease accessory protein